MADKGRNDISHTTGWGQCFFLFSALTIDTVGWVTS